MNLIIIIAILVPIAGCAADKDSPIDFHFSEDCKRENQLKNEFDELKYDEWERKLAWANFLKIRQERIDNQIQHNMPDCSEMDKRGFEKVAVLTDDELLGQLCLEAKSMETELSSCHDGLVKGELARLSKIATQRLDEFAARLGNKQCPASESDGYEKAAPKLREYFNGQCELEVYYNRLREISGQVESKIRSPKLFELEVEAREELDRVVPRRSRFCQGSTIECCGLTLVEGARMRASLKVAETIVNTIDEWVKCVSAKRKDRKEAHEVLVQVEKAYKKEYNERSDPLAKEQSRLGLELLSKKRAELETSGDLSGSKFSLFKFKSG